MDKSKLATKSVVNMTRLLKKNHELTTRKVPAIEKYPFIYSGIPSTTKCLSLICMDFLTVLVSVIKLLESKKLPHLPLILALPAWKEFEIMSCSTPRHRSAMKQQPSIWISTGLSTIQCKSGAAPFLLSTPRFKHQKLDAIKFSRTSRSLVLPIFITLTLTSRTWIIKEVLKKNWKSLLSWCYRKMR